eukprot:scaffold27496_cov36-Cyclotella_meneghiniana.AAC.5
MSLDRVLDNNWILDNSISCLEENVKPFMAPAVALLFLERKALPLFLIIENKNPKQVPESRVGAWGARVANLLGHTTTLVMGELSGGCTNY